MSLALPPGARCFADANILVYHFVRAGERSDMCSAFLERVASGELLTYTTALAVSEAIHKVMLTEALTHCPPGRRPMAHLQASPEHVRALSLFPAAADELPKIGLEVLPVPLEAWREVTSVSLEYGLLTNDACTIALMRRHQITHLVTNDDDFDAVIGITVWKPRP